MPVSRRSKPPSLARALAYRNDEIPYKFMESWEVSFHEAQELFTETKRLLWMLEVSRRKRRRFDITAPLLILDEMWHTFVLFTREYASYCKRVFGTYVHHQPITRAHQEMMAEKFKRSPEETLTRLTEREVRQWGVVSL